MPKRFLQLACAVTALTLLVATTLRTRAATPALSTRSLDESFDSGMRHMVVEWDRTDPRPPAERRRALFDFTYQTYQASAWIPQSLFDRNVARRTVIGDLDTIIGEQVGLVRWRDNPDVPAFGMAPNADANAPRRWTVNCLVCHTAEIDGVAYFGAGTKTFDDRWLGESLKMLTADALGQSRPDPTSDEAVASEAHRILTAHHHDKIDSLTRARSTAFAASHVEMSMRTHAGAMPGVDEVGRGDVKTPPLWHTVAKMPGQRWYADGSFHGPYPLMASSMELEKDRPFDALSQVVVPIIKAEFDSVIRHLRPPRYPYAIDAALAEKGRALFNSRQMGCAGCHGTYDGRGHVDWPGEHMDVGTDPSRLAVVSAPFIDAFNHSPLAVDGALKKSRGYAATPLTGVWANYPYLHNGSVPTLYHLLGPVSERPSIFDVMAARTLDRERVGQPLARDPIILRMSQDLLRLRFGNDRNWFNTARPGSSNVGHDVWPTIRTDANRWALIEYLKTL